MRNTLSFSFSRKGSFDGCRRQYYLNYYGSSGGWFKNAAPRVKETYYLKKLGNVYTWAGNVVHDTIEWILKRKRDKGMTPNLEEAQKFSKSMLLRQYEESQKRRDLWNARETGWTKLFGLKEHVYDGGVRSDKRRMVFKRVNDCLTHFFSSEIYQKISESDTWDWKAIEDFSTYDVRITDDFYIPVYSVPDFAMKHEGKLYIYDWKTGKHNPKYQKQLSLYAVYAERFWDVAPEDIVCEIFYLLPNTTEIVDVSRETINTMVADIKVGALELLDTLVDRDPVKNEALPESEFPLATSTSQCFFCTFSKVCGIRDKR